MFKLNNLDIPSPAHNPSKAVIGSPTAHPILAPNIHINNVNTIPINNICADVKSNFNLSKTGLSLSSNLL